MKKFKLTRITCVIAIMATIFCSCKKSDQKPTTTTNSVVGYWFGSFDAGTVNQSFLLRADGTLKVYDFYENPSSRDTTIAYDGTGTYSVSGNTITISTSFPNGESYPNSKATLDFTATPPKFTGTDGSVYVKQN
jgi:hypothetical protein